MGVFVACAAVIYTALRLTPSRTGVGTHQAMGFFACNMLATTGIPCPSCGMTTSFAWFYRAHLLASLYVQPCGFVLAYLVAVVCVSSMYECCTGRPVHRLLRIFPTRAWVIVGCGILASGWAWKIMIHLMHVDGWPVR